MNGMEMARMEKRDGLAPIDATLAGEVMMNGSMLTRTQTSYTTAMTVQRPRNLNQVASRLDQEADLSGEDFYYGWGKGKDAIEGPSVKLALAAVRCYGNCVIDQQPVIETPTSYVFGATFVDLETGFTLTRQFRQSKTWTVYGKMDEERKADIRFQIGQSKAIRNVVLNCIPSGLIERALKRAKSGALQRIEKKIEERTLAGAAEDALLALQKCGVSEKLVLSRFGIASAKAINKENLVIIAGDIRAIQGGQAYAEELYPPEDAGAGDLNDRVTGQTTADASGSSPGGSVPEANSFVDYSAFATACNVIAQEKNIDPEVADEAIKRLPAAGHNVKAIQRSKSQPAMEAVYEAMKNDKFDWKTSKIKE